MTVVRISIRKELLFGKSMVRRPGDCEKFASEYLIRTDATLLSNQLKEYAQNLALAESRLYPTSVLFTKASIKLATPGASAEELKGQFAVTSLNRLRGELVIAPGDRLANPPVTAVFVRQAHLGRSGRLMLPHALTEEEWHLYNMKRVRPPRLLKAESPGSESSEATTPKLSFSQELFEAIRPANGTFILPSLDPENPHQVRLVEQFVFIGFQVAPLPTKKKKKSTKRPILHRAELDAVFATSMSDAEADSELDAEPPVPPKRGTKTPIPGVVYMLQAGQHFKIGKSIDLEKRLTQIRLQLPYPVELVHVIHAADPLQAESHWHRRFAALRRNGEWFELGAGEVREFKSVAKM